MKNTIHNLKIFIFLSLLVFVSVSLADQEFINLYGRLIPRYNTENNILSIPSALVNNEEYVNSVILEYSGKDEDGNSLFTLIQYELGKLHNPCTDFGFSPPVQTFYEECECSPPDPMEEFDYLLRPVDEYDIDYPLSEVDGYSSIAPHYKLF